MKRKITKFFIIVLTLSLASLSCGKNTEKNTADKDNIQKVEENKQNENPKTETFHLEKYEEEMNFGKGIDEEFTTDGKLHEDKFLNKNFGYPDTADSFKIEKEGEDYFITEYIEEISDLEEDKPLKEEKSKLELKNDVYLVAEDGLVYAYDTNFEKLVFLNQENDLKIIYIADEE